MVSIQALPNQIGLTLYDKSGRERAAVETVDWGGSNQLPHVVLRDQAETDRASLAANYNGPALDLYDASGKPKISVLATVNKVGTTQDEKAGVFQYK